MQKLLLVTLCLLCFKSYSQIPNADFENWYTDSIMSRLSPVDWDCSNTDISPATTSVFQDVGYLSTYSVKFISVPGTGLIADGGYLYLTNLYSNPNRPTSLKGYWKVNNPGNNHDLFSIHLYMNDASGNLIGTGTTTSPTTSSIGNWTAFTTTINYTTNDPVSQYTINIDWSPLSSNLTGYAYIDGLSFNIPTGINEFEFSSKVELDQFTADNYSLNFKLSSQAKVNVELFDLTGRQIKEISNAVYPAGENSIPVDVANLQSGIYLCRYTSGNLVRTFRLVKD